MFTFPIKTFNHFIFWAQVASRKSKIKTLRRISYVYGICFIKYYSYALPPSLKLIQMFSFYWISKMKIIYKKKNKNSIKHTKNLKNKKKHQTNCENQGKILFSSNLPAWVSHTLPPVGCHWNICDDLLYPESNNLYGRRICRNHDESLNPEWLHTLGISLFGKGRGHKEKRRKSKREEKTWNKNKM